MEYDKRVVTDILAAANIVTVIQQAGIELRQKGHIYQASCPFHHEKEPSFIVDPSRERYHCFGCDKKGDAIGFLMDYEGLPFPEALRKLGAQVNIKVPEFKPETPEEKRKKDEIYRALDEASAFFTRKLRDTDQGALARQYLKNRGLDDETIHFFKLGYAPDGWTNLLNELRRKDFGEETLEQVGLIRRGDRGTCYDFFRNRLMIPLVDVSEQVVGFAGRDLGDSQVKYLNSPETEVYKKSKFLYGLNLAKIPINKKKQAIVVEGYLDLIQMFRAGFDNVLCTGGTSLTKGHADLLKSRFSNLEVILCFDGDDAGVQAAIRAGAVLVGKTNSSVCLIPGGKDPADIIELAGTIEQAREELESYLQQTTPYLDFYCNKKFEGLDLEDFATGQRAKETIARDIWPNVPDENKRAFLEKIAQKLGLSIDAIKDYFDGLAVVDRGVYTPGRQLRFQPSSRYWETVFLGQVMALPALSRNLEKTLGLKIEPEEFSSRERYALYRFATETKDALLSPGELFQNQFIGEAIAGTVRKAEKEQIEIDTDVLRQDIRRINENHEKIRRPSPSLSDISGTYRSWKKEALKQGLDDIVTKGQENGVNAIEMAKRMKEVPAFIMGK
jgi:DNA primase